MGALITKSRPRHVAAASDVDSAITRVSWLCGGGWPTYNTTHDTTRHNATEGEAQLLSSFFFLLSSFFLCAQPRDWTAGLLDC